MDPGHAQASEGKNTITAGFLAVVEPDLFARVPGMGFLSGAQSPSSRADARCGANPAELLSARSTSGHLLYSRGRDSLFVLHIHRSEFDCWSQRRGSAGSAPHVACFACLLCCRPHLDRDLEPAGVAVRLFSVLNQMSVFELCSREFIENLPAR